MGRQDVSKPESDESNRFGACQCCNAVVCSILGLVILIISCLIMQHAKLQIRHYAGNSSLLLLYPDILRGCVTATIAGSVIQIISSLMALFQDIGVNVWRWMKFTVFMISAVSAGFVAKEQHDDIDLYRPYYVMLIVNCILCGIFIICDTCS